MSRCQACTETGRKRPSGDYLCAKHWREYKPDTPEGMQAVDCPLCGMHLGWQEADTPIDQSVWVHSRCPERLARAWDLTRDQVESLTNDVQTSIAAAFPDLPPLGGRELRLRIAAEHVLETLASRNLVVGAQSRLKGNIYGRFLPIDKQGGSSVCVTCGHPHFDTILLMYVRCGMCECENFGRNDVPLAPEKANDCNCIADKTVSNYCLLHGDPTNPEGDCK